VFITTRWSLVLSAARAPSPESQAALEDLCRAYWYPLYAYVRRRGRSPEDAQDLTQEFFYRLLGSDWIARADRTKGRFRSFLLRGLQNFLANEWQKVNRVKRGGGGEIVALVGLEAEERYQIEPVDLASADRLFERRWALTLLDRVLERLRTEQIQAGLETRFEVLRGTLVGEPVESGYRLLAQRFGVTESTVQSWVHRLRARYRELLQDEVAQTVASAEEIQDELRHLAQVLNS
jgi:RNA polymerase sigma-70 factor (ECF subfamily)